MKSVQMKEMYFMQHYTDTLAQQYLKMFCLEIMTTKRVILKDSMAV